MSMSLYDFITNNVKGFNIVDGFDMDNMDQQTFGAIMHDEDVAESTKIKIADIVEEMGGYECLAKI